MDKRNKVPLAKGYSLMDWNRLCLSGKDLAGTGGRMLQITPSELKKHRKKDDAWLALYGKVFNVTEYMDYHPGGTKTLLAGAGKDCTELFNKTHAWVNWQSLLSKCFIGVLIPDRMRSRDEEDDEDEDDEDEDDVDEDDEDEDDIDEDEAALTMFPAPSGPQRAAMQ